ncbi:MAG: hypothetical protein PVG71_10780 [Anaerolineae bacterium]
MADARTPLIRAAYGAQWFVPALYGRPADVDRLFDETTPLPQAAAGLRAAMRDLRGQMADLERAIGTVGAGTLAQPATESTPGMPCCPTGSTSTSGFAASGMLRRDAPPPNESRYSTSRSVIQGA